MNNTVRAKQCLKYRVRALELPWCTVLEIQAPGVSNWYSLRVNMILEIFKCLKYTEKD